MLCRSSLRRWLVKQLPTITIDRGENSCPNYWERGNSPPYPSFKIYTNEGGATPRRYSAKCLQEDRPPKTENWVRGKYTPIFAPYILDPSTLSVDPICSKLGAAVPNKIDCCAIFLCTEGSRALYSASKIWKALSINPSKWSTSTRIHTWATPSPANVVKSCKRHFGTVLFEHMKTRKPFGAYKFNCQRMCVPTSD